MLVLELELDGALAAKLMVHAAVIHPVALPRKAQHAVAPHLGHEDVALGGDRDPTRVREAAEPA